MRTTLNKIYEAHPQCMRGWNALLNYTGKTEPDDALLSFNKILDAIGLQGAIWCLRALDGVDKEKEMFYDFCQEGQLHPK